MDIKNATNGELVDEIKDIHGLKRDDAYTEIIARMDYVQVKGKKGFDTPTVPPPIP